MSDSGVGTWLVDAHVHIHDCFELDQLLDAALFNFTHAAKIMADVDGFTGVLLLSETSRDNWFARFSSPQPSERSDSRWQIEKTQETEVLKASLKNESDDDAVIFIIAGRQIITAEGLELLALITDSMFEDGLPAVETLRTIRDHDAIPVFPWAVGKWLGKRGKFLSDLLQLEAQGELYLGDNSGRPVFWGKPSHFKQAHALNMSILPGTDPLPMSEQALRVGSFGFSVHGQLRKTQPATDLKQLLRKISLREKGTKLETYGRLENPWRFFINQIRLRRAK